MKDSKKKIKEQIDDAIRLVDTKKKVMDNTIEFNYKEDKYRVSLPTLEEEQELEKAKAKKLNQILSEVDENNKPVYLFKKQWKDIYLKRGIDLDKKEGEINIINIDREVLLKKLAETKDVPEIRNIEKQLDELKTRLEELVMYITDKYQYCIEYVLLFFSKNYLLSLVLEKLDRKVKKDATTIKNINKWKKVYNTFDKMKKERDIGLLRLGLVNLSYLVDFGIESVE